MDEEVEAIRNALSGMTKATFEISKPKPGESDPVHGNKIEWYIFCSDATYHSQTVHVQGVWADIEGNIWLASSILGLASDWVKEKYGEQGSLKLMRMRPHDFSNPRFRTEFRKEFPAAMNAFEMYNLIVSRISLRRNVRLHMRYDGSEAETTLTLGAKIEAKGMDLQSKLNEIEKNVHALKEAYVEIKAH